MRNRLFILTIAVAAVLTSCNRHESTLTGRRILECCWMRRQSSPADRALQAELVKCVGRIAVHETDLDLHAAIDGAANRVGRLLGQRLEKEKELTFGSEAARAA